MPKATVVICTWNRADSLRRTLESLVAMQAPAQGAWEVLVVNNNSTDDTDAAVDGFRDRLPIRRITERAQGLSNARNAGARAAQGDYLVWTDDDVIVDRAWLAKYLEAFDRHPDAAIFGGRVVPKFEEPVPDWLVHGWRAVPAAFAAVDLGDAPVELGIDRTPYGANFVIRRSEQLAHPFDPGLGAAPGGRYYAEETTVMETILREGGKGVWVPGASVEHCIPRERMTFAYLKAYYLRNGRTDYFVHSRNAAERKRRLLGRPRWVWRHLVESEAAYWAARVSGARERWLGALAERYRAWGRFEESARR